MAERFIKEASQLANLLSKMYGDRIQIEDNPLRLTNCGVDGVFDSKQFGITFQGDFLILSVEAKGNSIIEELTAILKEVMGGEQPLCSYDLQDNVRKERIMPTIEWDLCDPEGRVKELVNGRGYDGDFNILNLKLYNSKKVEDYLESEEEKQEKIKDARIYGIDPGCIDVKSVKDMSEFELFLTIESLGAYIWKIRHEMAHYRIPYVDLTEEDYGIEYLVYQTTRFGVELEEPTVDKHVEKTPSYNAWYQFYHNHLYQVLTKEQCQELSKIILEGGDYSSFLPSGNWKDLIEKPTQKRIQE